MEIKTLYTNLTKAYSEQNLNKLTSEIITLYKEHQHDLLLKMADTISEYVDIIKININRVFPRLIMIYHPDMTENYRNLFRQLYENKKFDELNKYSHILAIQNMEKKIVKVESNVDENIDFKSEYEWDEELEDGYEFYHDEENEHDDYDNFNYVDIENDHSLFTMFKKKIYGNINVDLPTIYLEDLEAVELSGMEIDDISGVKHCRQTVFLDLSNNHIVDISDLEYLTYVREIYISKNKIGFIDAISFLENLEILDISNNSINDISPLFDLKNLAFLNISKNDIPEEQVLQIKQNGVIVIQ